MNYLFQVIIIHESIYLLFFGVVFHENKAKMIGLSISITAIISICMCIIYKRSKKRRDDTFERTAMTDLNELPLLSTPWDGSHGVYTGNSSGRGPPHLHQRTIAKEISNASLIGHGRFGTVFKGKFQILYKYFQIFN